MPPQSLSNFNLTSIFPEINTAVPGPNAADNSGKHLKGSAVAPPPPTPTSIQQGVFMIVITRAVMTPALEPAREPDLGAASVMAPDPALFFK